MSNFKIILISVFIGGAVIGILVFSGVINIGGQGSNKEVEGTATIWGTLDTRAMSPFLDDYDLRNVKVKVHYVQISETTFADDLIEAIASGKAPDLVLLPDNLLWRFDDKLAHIPYTSIPERTFSDSFVSGANIFLASDGVLAIPFTADPIVMYYNRDILEGSGFSKPPSDWTSFKDMASKLTKRDQNLSFIQNGAALGTYRNITHVKDIFALLFISASNPFITRTSGNPLAHFGIIESRTEATSAITATNFFLSFADPAQESYTWNAGEVNDRDAFVQGRLAFYFGTSSELPLLRALNPNLNFDVALPPRLTNGLPSTTGRFYGLAIPKVAKNPTLSYSAANLLTNTASSSALIEKAGTTLAMMPVRRDVLANKPADDRYVSLFYNLVLVMRSWFDPDPVASSAIIQTLIGDITSGFLTTDQALSKAASQIQATRPR